METSGVKSHTLGGRADKEQIKNATTIIFTPQSRDVQNDEAAKSEASQRESCANGCRRSRNSLESLYSLKSGQSSSSKTLLMKSVLINTSTLVND